MSETLVQKRDRLVATRNSTREELLPIQRRATILQSQLTALNQEIGFAEQELKAERSKPRVPIITDHAILRYLERVKGIDVEGLKARLLPEAIKEAILEFESGKFYLDDGTELRVKDRHVVTVVIPEKSLTQ